MPRFFRKALVLLTAIVLVTGLLVTCVSNRFEQFVDTPLVLNFIETTDVHGAIFPYDFITGRPMTASMAQVATFVAAQRAAGNEVILMDNGDSLQGQPTVYYYNFIKTDVTNIWTDTLNFLKYDVVSVGNHDIEAGHPVYDKMEAELNMPYICANIVDAESGEPYFPPYAIITRQGVKIAVLGLTEPGIAHQLPNQFWSGMEIIDMVETARKWIPIIQEEEAPDLIVGLFHAGVDYTYGGATADTVGNESGSQLVVERVDGFDFIFVGHDHAGWDGKGWDPVAKVKVDVKDPAGNVVPIYGANAGATNVASVTVTMQWNRETKAWAKTVAGALVPMAGLAADPEFVAHFEPAKAELLAWVQRPIGAMVGRVTSHDALFGDSAFVDLIHRIQFEVCADPANGLKPARISFAAPLDQNAFLPTTTDGTILVRDMFSLYKYENFLYTMELTGQQIKAYMEYNYAQWMNQMASENDHLINFSKAADGSLVFNARYNTYDTVAGIRYTVDVSKPAGSRVTIAGFMDGSAFSLTETYTVAINSYRGSGGGNHLTRGAGLDAGVLRRLELVTSTTTKDLRYYMLRWFEKQTGPITVATDNNWRVIPETWAAAGRIKSFPLLYPTP